MIDLVKAYVDAKDQYRAARGWTRASGKWSPGSNEVPTTTVADVEVVAAKFKELYDQARAQFPRTLNDDTIRRTENAYQKWKASLPESKYWFGRPPLDSVYPHNDEFWGTAGQMLLQASAAGVVPGQWDLAVESVKEAVKEAADNIAKAGLNVTKLLVYGAAIYIGVNLWRRK